MTQEEKSLLLKDLCARLNDGVKVHCEWNMFQGGRCSEDGELVAINIHAKSIHFKRNSGRITEIPFNRIDGTVLPYLRPMSSMTEEEDEWLNDRINFSRDDEVDKIRQKWGIVMQEIYTNSSRYVFSNFTEILDWLNSHHFDYRGLIEKGLALEATEGMYK